MRKKQLIEQNIQLFEELKKTEKELADVKKKLASRENEIAGLTSEIERLRIPDTPQKDALTEEDPDDYIPQSFEEPEEQSDCEIVEEIPDEDLEQPESQLKEISLKEEKTEEADTVPVAPIQKLTDKVMRNVSVSRDVEYGAEVIGKIVVYSAEYSNRLTSGGETRYKELVNLMLGRTEVAKADILNCVISDEPFESKKEKIDRCFEEACEYFDSIMGQRI